jgi:hypothetical protein
VCWAIVGHLVVGMLAGYVVLADRSHREMQPERPEVVVSVSVVAEDQSTVQGILRDAGAKRVGVSGPGATISRP